MAKIEGRTVMQASPFLHPGNIATASSIAILHLRRDQLQPIVLQAQTDGSSGYAEGSVTNTRFGSYPHSTIIGEAWGTQILASKVDTGSRGRGQKRKAVQANGHEHANKKLRLNDGAEVKPEPDSDEPQKLAVAAKTGFCHVLPPTPESWTISLPHRTQVVYTPDYSYVLQKLQARPGSVLIEAGAGSGSFTHGAARAVFSGYTDSKSQSKAPRGRVFSFEYHEPRAEQLTVEIEKHGLSSVVQVTHRDVYKDGFLVQQRAEDGSLLDTLVSPKATQIFLDLPAPWQALPHLTRSDNSPLDPEQTAHICIFLPCIEQVSKAVAALRTHGWVEINMQDLSQRRLEVRRERIGLDLQGLRGVNATPATVEEAIERLLEVEQNGRRYQNVLASKSAGDAADASMEGDAEPRQPKKAEKPARTTDDATDSKGFKDGRLVQRTEPDVKTHTSYLIFAVLPRDWTDNDEAKCRQRWASEKNGQRPADKGESRQNGKKQRGKGGA